MIVDLHVHTFPASTCSAISYEGLLAHCRDNQVHALALTNHGSIADNRLLESPLADIGVVLVHGVEISTPYGDFTVFSPDLDYLATFDDVQAVPKAGELPAGAALVWVHPAAGGGRSGSTYYPGLAEVVAPIVDAVEVWNGNWADRQYVETAEAIARTLGRPATGGSDAHQVERIGRCATRIDGEVRSTADVVSAIKAGAVAPVAPKEGDRRGLGGLLDRFKR